MKNHDFSKTLFWDSNLSLLNLQQHKSYIIERVVTRGGYHDWKELFSIYRPEEIKEQVVNIKTLDPKTLNFLSIYFSVPKSDFVCYKNPYRKEIH